MIHRSQSSRSRRSNVHRRSEVEELAKEFANRYDEFIGESEKVKRDFSPAKTATFDVLCERVREAGARVTKTDNNGNQTGRAELRDSLDAVLQFLH